MNRFYLFSSVFFVRRPCRAVVAVEDFVLDDPLIVSGSSALRRDAFDFGGFAEVDIDVLIGVVRSSGPRLDGMSRRQETNAATIVISIVVGRRRDLGVGYSAGRQAERLSANNTAAESLKTKENSYIFIYYTRTGDWIMH